MFVHWKKNSIGPTKMSSTLDVVVQAPTWTEICEQTISSTSHFHEAVPNSWCCHCHWLVKVRWSAEVDQVERFGLFTISELLDYPFNYIW